MFNRNRKSLLAFRETPADPLSTRPKRPLGRLRLKPNYGISGRIHTIETPFAAGLEYHREGMAVRNQANTDSQSGDRCDRT